MPTRRPKRQPPSSDRRQLSAFLAKVQALLKKIATRTTYSGVEIPKKLRAALRAAWNEVATTFRKVRAGLAKVTNEQLDGFGLRGKQLAFKLAVVNQYKDDLFRTLKLFDPLLKSILDCLGIGHGISEFKEYVELLLG